MARHLMDLWERMGHTVALQYGEDGSVGVFVTFGGGGGGGGAPGGASALLLPRPACCHLDTVDGGRPACLVLAPLPESACPDLASHAAPHPSTTRPPGAQIRAGDTAVLDCDADTGRTVVLNRAQLGSNNIVTADLEIVYSSAAA